MPIRQIHMPIAGAIRVAAAALAIAALSAAGACSNPFARDTDLTQLGALPDTTVEGRVRAVEAFRGIRAPLTLHLAFTTVEGDSIFHTLVVEQGRAVLTRDESREGGGVRVDTLTALEIVRYIPSVWVNNQEIAKERLEAVQPASARTEPGQYLLRGRTCPSDSCDLVF